MQAPGTTRLLAASGGPARLSVWSTKAGRRRRWVGRAWLTILNFVYKLRLTRPRVNALERDSCAQIVGNAWNPLL